MSIHLTKPLPVFLFFLLLSLSGGWLAAFLPLSLLPESDIACIRITFEASDLTAEAIEAGLTGPARSQFRILHQLEDIKTTAWKGSGIVELWFKPGTDMDQAWFETQSSLDDFMALLSLPVRRPAMQRVSALDFPILELAVLPGGTEGLQDFPSWAGWARDAVVKRMEQLPGVAFADIGGVPEEVIRLEWRAARPTSPWCTEAMVGAALMDALGANKSVVLGNGSQSLSFTYQSSLPNLEALKNLPICDRMLNLRLKDMCLLNREESSEGGTFWVNGKRGLVLNLYQKPGSDLMQLRKNLRTLIAEVNAAPGQPEVRVLRDQTELLVENLRSLSESFLIAFGVILLLLVWVYPNKRMVLLLGVSMPVTLLLSFNGIYALGISLNSFSLFGLIIGNGLVIDNGIVVLENIIRKRASGFSRLEACKKGSAELAGPIIASAVTTGIVFLPLTFQDGLTGILFVEQLKCMGIALTSSVLVALLLIPTGALYFFSGADYRVPNGSSFMRQLNPGFLLAMSGYVGLMVLGVLSFQTLRVGVFPDLPSEGRMYNSNPVQAGKDTLENMELYYAQHTVVQYRGHLGLFFEAAPQVESNDRWVVFLSGKAGTDPVSEKNSTPLPGIFQHVFSRDGKKLGQPRIYYTGARALPDPFGLQDLSGLLWRENGAQLVIPLQEQKHWHTDPIRESIYGITPEDIQANTGLWQTKVFGKLSLDGLDIVQGTRLSPGSDFMKEPVFKTAGGSYLAPKAFSDLDSGLQLGVIQADLKGIYVEVNSPDNVPLSLDLQRYPGWPGDWKISFPDTRLESVQQLRQGVGLVLTTLLLLYLVLAILFNAFLLPLYVLSVVPAGIGGALLGLFLGGDTLNIVSMTGMVLVCGIVVNDAILKVDLIIRLSRVMPVAAAVKRAKEERWRAIVMTSLTTIVSLAPAVWGTDFSHAIQKPLALAVIGGLFFGTLASIWFIPHLFKVKR